MERMRNPSLLVCGLKHGKIWPKLPSNRFAPYVKTANPLALNVRRPARPSTPLTFATAAGAEMSSSSHASAWPPFVRILSVHTVLMVASPSVANPKGVGDEGSQLLTSNIPDRGPNLSTSVNLTTLCHAEAGGATCADAGDVAAIANGHTRMPMIPQLAHVHPRFMTGPPLSLSLWAGCYVRILLFEIRVSTYGPTPGAWPRRGDGRRVRSLRGRAAPRCRRRCSPALRGSPRCAHPGWAPGDGSVPATPTDPRASGRAARGGAIPDSPYPPATPPSGCVRPRGLAGESRAGRRGSWPLPARPAPRRSCASPSSPTCAWR